MNDRKVDMIVDLQFGSTGKGLLAGWLAKQKKYDTVISANMPNAGHTFIDSNGRKWVHKVLPNGIVSPALETVMIGPGSIFNPEQLIKELNESRDLLGKVEILIHPAAVALTSQHTAQERSRLQQISSTMQGSAAAMINKLWRDPSNNPTVGSGHSLRDYPILSRFVCDHKDWEIALTQSNKILAEGSQGYSLGINSRFYPYTTSRDCTPGRFASDMGIPIQMISEIIGTCRTYPIRVGNVQDGYSGTWYPGQKELSWEQIGQVPETTTVTGRIRRVAEFSVEQIREAIWMCRPSWVFLNFANYCSPKENAHIEAAITGAASTIGMQEIWPYVRVRGYGPSESDMVIHPDMGGDDWWLA